MRAAPCNGVSGRIDFMFLAWAAAVPRIRGGKLRPLAVTGGERLAPIPDVPTMRQAGLPDFVIVRYIDQFSRVARHAGMKAD